MAFICNLCDKTCSSMANLKMHTVLCYNNISEQKCKMTDKTENFKTVKQNKVLDTNSDDHTLSEPLVKKEEV